MRHNVCAIMVAKYSPGASPEILIVLFLATRLEWRVRCRIQSDKMLSCVGKEARRIITTKPFQHGLGSTGEVIEESRSNLFVVKAQHDLPTSLLATKYQQGGSTIGCLCPIVASLCIHLIPFSICLLKKAYFALVLGCLFFGWQHFKRPVFLVHDRF